MKFREFVLESGTKTLLGKNESNNDTLMSLYKGKSNVILHTVAPGSPFCVIDSSKPTKKEVYEAAVACASKSQDWRDNKTDTKVHKFTGKDATKRKGMKVGCWTVRKSKTLTVKKADIREIPMVMGQLQIGKNGLTKNFYFTLDNMFKKHSFVKVNVLKSARGEGKEAKKQVKKLSEDILKELGNKYTAKLIGFTITLKKWRKPQR